MSLNGRPTPVRDRLHHLIYKNLDLIESQPNREIAIRQFASSIAPIDTETLLKLALEVPFIVEGGDYWTEGLVYQSPTDLLGGIVCEYLAECVWDKLNTDALD